ncbi:MAG: M64 family metallopeptidase [Candidatus Omnitrophota bacterium]
MVSNIASFKKHVLTFGCCLLIALPFLMHSSADQTGSVPFDTYFVDKTMRLDYFHSGNVSEDHFAPDKIFSDGPWAGRKTTLVDHLNRGLYRFEVMDKESGTLLYSDGFASVYGEWETTGEAKKQWGTFHESLRFPWPKKPVHVVVKKRNSQNRFVETWTMDIDPAARNVNSADILHTEKTFTLMKNGPSDQKVDVVILGDGYTPDEMEKFHKDAQRLTNVLFNTEPFKSRKSDFNVRAVDTPSAISGVTRPHFGIFKRTPLSVHYSSFDSERYALTYDNRAVRNAASAVPYDVTFVLINERIYGGGGIYNLYASVSSDSAFADYIFVHEFGHHFAALSDEYYTSPVSYEMETKITVEPWEPNITALLDKDNLKWKDLVKSGTPIPTPWDKEKYDAYSMSIQKERQHLRDIKAKEEDMETLLLGEKQKLAEMMSGMKYKDAVGAFEGANYYFKGMYRPSIDCIMFTRNMTFCPVCRRAIEQVIDQYTH